MRTNSKIMIMVMALAIFGISGGAFVLAAEDDYNAQQAIDQAGEFQSNEGKIAYLIQEGQEFVDGSNYAEAQEVARYILNEIDPQSQEAKDLLSEAQKEMQAGAMDSLNKMQ